MKKRVISALLSLITVLSIAPSAFAFGSEATPVDKYPSGIGILTTDDGSQYIIQGKVVSESPASASTPNATVLGENGQASVTYLYDIPESLTKSSYDSGVVSTVYLTITYKTRNTPTEYLLTGVSGKWVITDSKASVESATLSYGCTGVFPSPTTQSVRNVPVENNFSISTGFTDYVTSAASAYDVMGANLTLGYLMGTSRRWTFTLTNNLF